MVGFSGALTEQNAAQSHFREMCDKYIEGIEGHHDERLIPLDNRYQVIFYREYGAFPIRLWTHLKALQQAYERQLEKSRLPIHLGGKSENYLPIIKAAKEDIDRLATLYLVGTIPEIGVFDPEPDSSGYRLDFTQGGLRRVLRFSGPLSETANRLYEAEVDGVPEHVAKQISKMRNSLGDEDFTRAILAFRNSLYDKDLDQEKRDYHLALLDSYLAGDRGLTEARRSQSVAPESRETKVTVPPAATPKAPTTSEDPATNGDVSPSGSTSSIPEQIKKLGELHQAGILTTEEFETKKRQLLDRM
jgi:hypothetical protein